MVFGNVLAEKSSACALGVVGGVCVSSLSTIIQYSSRSNVLVQGSLPIFLQDGHFGFWSMPPGGPQGRLSFVGVSSWG